MGHLNACRAVPSKVLLGFMLLGCAHGSPLDQSAPKNTADLKSESAQPAADAGADGEAATAEPKPCSTATLVGEACALAPSDIHPTQFALGMLDVQRKREKIATLKNDPKQLRDYLKSNIGTAVKGPEDKFYIVDGHHRARALLEEEVPAMWIKVTVDDSDLTMADFWEHMMDDQNVWLYDENGSGPQNPIHVPDSLKDLKDDPYRTLSEDAQNKGAYKKTDTHYQEFIWANFFRKLIPAEKLQKEYDAALEDAVRLAKTTPAMNLPGYTGPQS